MGENINAYRVFVGEPEEKKHKEDIDAGESIILKWILGK
jgi:hypothetical protein